MLSLHLTFIAPHMSHRTTHRTRLCSTTAITPKPLSAPCKPKYASYTAGIRFVNCRALPTHPCCNLRLTQIRSPSYITHWAKAPTATSFADWGASHHTRTPLQIQPNRTSKNLTANSLLQHDTNNIPSIKFVITTSANKHDSAIIRN